MSEAIHLVVTDITRLNDDSGFARLDCIVDTRHLKRLIAGAALAEQWPPALLLKVVPIDES